MRRLFIALIGIALSASAVMAQVVQAPVMGKTGIALYNRRVPRTEIILPQVKGYNIGVRLMYPRCDIVMTTGSSG